MLCPVGYYCIGGIKSPCPGGKFGNVTTQYLETCSGNCTAGYYCPEGSKTPTEMNCGNANVFCPEGSATPQSVDKGYYSTPLEKNEENRDGQKPFE